MTQHCASLQDSPPPYPTDNLSAVLYGIEDMRMEQRPIPEPNDNQVLLVMESVGICGSDVSYLVKGRIGPFVVNAPMVIGHEGAGTVVKCGKNVKGLQPGDHVAIEPQVPCRRCVYCKSGNYNLCPDIFFCATPPDDGNLSRYYVHDYDFCHKLPCHMSLDEGALMEPLAVGVHACNRAKVKSGDTVLVLGAGPIGLVTMLAARAYGASNIMIVDIREVRVNKAKELGADIAIQIDENIKEDEFVAKIKGMLGEPNVTFECTGAATCIRVALVATRTNGVVNLIGMGEVELTVPISAALFREVDILGIFRYVNAYPTAIDMVASGKIDVKPLITHHYTIEDSLKAFHVAKTQEGEPIKVMIHPNPNWKDCKSYAK